MIVTTTHQDLFGSFELMHRENRGRPPLVSVIMGVYNDTGYLRESIESVLAQTFTDFEFVIIDDRSTDSSAETIKAFLEKDPRIVFLRSGQRLGLTKSLLRGIPIARAPFLARQDADDTSDPKRLERQMSFLPEYDFVCCRTKVDEKKISPKQITIEFYKYVMPFKNPFIHGTFLLKRSLYEQAGGYDPEVPYAQDYDLMMRVVKIPNVKIKYLPDVLYYSHKGKMCLSQSESGKQLAFARLIQRKYGLRDIIK
jgi:glycosyltransferase involved in cell wall biosynthesis